MVICNFADDCGKIQLSIRCGERERLAKDLESMIAKLESAEQKLAELRGRIGENEKSGWYNVWQAERNAHNQCTKELEALKKAASAIPHQCPLANAIDDAGSFNLCVTRAPKPQPQPDVRSSGSASST